MGACGLRVVLFPTAFRLMPNALGLVSIVAKKNVSPVVIGRDASETSVGPLGSGVCETKARLSIIGSRTHRHGFRGYPPLLRKRSYSATIVHALLLTGAVCLSHCENAVGERRMHRAQRWLRSFAILTDRYSQYGLKFDSPLTTMDEHRPLVIVVHGFNSSGAAHQSLIGSVRSAGFACGTFEYPNDQPLTDSARLLSRELRALRRQHPRIWLSLVTHSMGGLVARELIENPQLDPGGVEQLIMIAPPNHGSMWALLYPGADLWEHGIRGGAHGPLRRLQASVVDGMAEAQRDLRPGSPFLQRLNARSRNAKVQYSILLGTSAPIAAAHRSETQSWYRYVTSHIGRGHASLEHVDRLLTECDELIAGAGDGVVAVKRGRLQGVHDTILLPFDHLAVTGNPTDAGVRLAHAAVLSRLRRITR